MAFTPVFSWTPDATSTNWRGYTTRFRINATLLSAGTKFRIVAKGHPTQSTTISACVIAEGATSGASEHGYKYPPISVTWNGGSPGFTLAPGEELASDPITLTYDPATLCPLIVGTWMESTVPNTQDDVVSNNTVGGLTLYYKTGNDLNNQTPSGYNVATADGWLYIRIEKEDAPVDKKKPVVNFVQLPVDIPEVSFRFWRVLFEDTIIGIGSDTYASVSYLGFADLLGGSDLVDTGKYLTNSLGSPNFGTEYPSNAFRGVGNTSPSSMSPDGDGRWIGWDFESGFEKAIVEFLMRPRVDASYRNQFPNKFKLQSSPDGSTWTDRLVVDKSGDPTYVATVGTIFRFNSLGKPSDPGRDNPHSYWRVRAKSFIDGTWINFQNVKFYTDEAFTSLIPTTGAEYTASAVVEGSASGAFNGNRVTFRHQNRPSTAEIKYATPVVVKGLVMSSRPAYGGQSADTFSVDYSDNGYEWYESWAVGSQAPWTAGEERSFART